MELVYDKDIAALRKAAEEAQKQAEEKLKSAEELMAKRYGPLGATFAAAVGINRSNFPKKQEDIEDLVKEITAPWLETHPDGWIPSKGRRGRPRARASKPKQQQTEEAEVEEVIEVEDDDADDDENPPGSATEELHTEVVDVEDDSVAEPLAPDVDEPPGASLFGTDPFETAW